LKKYVALVQAMTAPQDKQLIEFFEGKKWGYWHWIDGGWLITDAIGLDANPCAAIRDEILKIAPEKFSCVFEVTTVPNQWAGFGPQAEGNSMFTWLKDHWVT
jgi:hypothetical protein